MDGMLWPSVGEGEVEKVEGIGTYYPFGLILKNSSTFFHFLLSHRLIFNTISRSIKAYPKIIRIDERLSHKNPYQPLSTSKPHANNLRPLSSSQRSDNTMILPFHTRLSNTDTPHMPRAHDSHRKTKHDIRDINQYEGSWGIRYGHSAGYIIPRARSICA